MAMTSGSVPKNLASREEKAMSILKECFRKMYGHATAEKVFPGQSLPGQCVIKFEYDRAGRAIKSQVKFEKFNCTGAANLLKPNIACKEDSEDVIAPKKEKQVATWTIKLPDGSVSDRVMIAEALLKMAPEDIDACAMKTFHDDDPMEDFLN